MNTEQTKTFLNNAWSTENTIIKSLAEFIAIPNISPSFDPEWATNGLLDKAVHHLAKSTQTILDECKTQGIPTDDITLRILGDASSPIINDDQTRRTPIILVDVPAFGPTPPDGTILLYGHLDKQPGLADQWSPGLGPHTPVIKDGKLYGRGGADDGYAIFSALSALLAVRQQGSPHARSVILIESCEESGSSDLEHYIRTLEKELGDVTLIICLDSGCQNYEQLWLTSSLRGVTSGALRIAVSREGVHSGDASGVIPTPFRILSLLLSRVENPETGEITPPELKVDIPPFIRDASAKTAALLGRGIPDQFPFLDGVQPAYSDLTDLVLARTWQSQLVIKGLDGFPPCAGSGNVLLPALTASLSFRLPPTLSSEKAAQFIKRTLEANPPYGAHVEYAVRDAGDGWAAPEMPEWMSRAINAGSLAFYGKDAMSSGDGGSIPFMGLLGVIFPRANFLVTGVLGPQANAHGPDEFLHIDMAKRVTMCVAEVIAGHGVAR